MATTPSVFKNTVDFNIKAGYDACAYSALTPYPGTLTWYEMKKAGRIVSYDWTMYDQGHVVFRPAKMEPDKLRLGLDGAYKAFYSVRSIASRFPLAGKRSRAQWAVYNLFMRKASRTENIDSIAPATPEPELAPVRRSCQSSENGAKRCWKRSSRKRRRANRRSDCGYASGVGCALSTPPKDAITASLICTKRAPGPSGPTDCQLTRAPSSNSDRASARRSA